MSAEHSYFFVKVQNGGFHRINFSELYFIKSIGNYLQFVTTQGSVTTHGSLQSLESMPDLQRYLLRIHRSYMVNLEKLEFVSSEHVIIADHSIPVGNKYWDELKSGFLHSHLMRI